ncbi:cyanophycin synthetase [Dehalobacter sp. DCM]|uniref:cyanophycin synthetase n=1 Tax=Dehalobacter sp. DCM TaxID=2907827 RepID=UPI003081984D|nr:cyanophycin synthetase [Dehalobacter sp. DCM]
MKICHVKAIEGANFFSHHPVICGIVDISQWLGKTTKEVNGFNERLLRVLPSLANHSCSRHKHGGFIERLEEGTFPGHVLEHICIELLALAGENRHYGKTRLYNEEKNEYEVIYEYECKEAGIKAIFLAGAILNKLYFGGEPEVLSSVNKLKRIRSQCMPGPSTQAILNACETRGIPFHRLGNGALYQLGHGRYQRKIQAAMSDTTSCIGVDMASDKQLTRMVLDECLFPVPRGMVVSAEKELLQCFKQINKNVVVKPCRGNQGKGVSINLGTKQELIKAYYHAQKYDSKVIIEEYIAGNNYRLLVIGGKLAAAARRLPPGVIGDGRSTVKELIQLENEHSLRGDGHDNYLSKIVIDPALERELARQGLSLVSVPLAGEKVILRADVNMSTGATAVDVTDRVHPDNIELAVNSSKLLGLDIAGVDMIVEDISKSYREQDGRVIEINAVPGLRMHLLPSEGRARDVGSDIIRMMFPKGNGRVPIISVTGTNGKTTVVRLINNMLQKQKLTVGMTSTEGIFINNKQISSGDHSGPQSAKAILRHPDVQVAVLETARGGILRDGLGYDYADVAVVTNVYEDHLGQHGIETLEDMTKVKSLVAEMVARHSYVVLNADDPQSASLVKNTRGRIIYFSSGLNNRRICKHLAIGGTAIIADGGKIKVCRGTECIPVCSLHHIPMTWAGKAAHHVYNVLAAVAAFYALGYTPDQIRKSVAGFGQVAEDNPGRLEYYDVGDFKVILDYGHNPAGVREIVNTLKQVKHRRMIGCIGIPGDRPDSIVRKLAREAAGGFDFLIIKEDSELRGRKKGEIAGILYDEVLKEKKQPEALAIVLDETEAFHQALDLAMPGDIVVIFYEKADSLRKIIADRQNKNISIAESSGDRL